MFHSITCVHNSAGADVVTVTGSCSLRPVIELNLQGRDSRFKADSRDFSWLRAASDFFKGQDSEM